MNKKGREGQMKGQPLKQNKCGKYLQKTHYVRCEMIYTVHMYVIVLKDGSETVQNIVRGP